MLVGTYKTVDSNIVWVSLSAGSTLNLEHVPKGIVLSIIGAQIGDTVILRLPLTSVKLQTAKTCLRHTLASQLSDIERT